MRWLALIALLFIFISDCATAEIVRSCKALLERGEATSIATINGEGTCKNKTKANECRERAREAIVICAKALFDARAEGTVLPAVCKGGRGARTAVLQWDQIIKGIRGNNLGDRVRWNACCKGKDPKTNKSLVVVTVTGDKGCGSTKIGKNLFQSDINIGTIFFDCQKQRQKGLCDG